MQGLENGVAGVRAEPCEIGAGHRQSGERNWAGPPASRAEKVRSRKKQPAAAGWLTGREKRRGTTMRIERRNTTQGQSPYAGINFRLATSARSRIPMVRSCSASRMSKCPTSGRRSPPTCWPRSISAKPASPPRLKKVEEETVPSFLWRSVPRHRGACAPAREPSASSASTSPSRCSIASPAAGPIGAGRAATSPPKKTRRLLSTSCATCSPCRWSRRTRRNGSTPACTGPTASMAPARATIMSTGRPAS